SRFCRCSSSARASTPGGESVEPPRLRDSEVPGLAMRGLKSTIALTVVLAAAGGYAWYLSKKSDSGTVSGSKQEKVFAALQADKIEELHISTADGEATTLKKDNGAWQLTAPLAAKADESEVNGITSALSSVEITRVIDENPANLNDYGLSNPHIVID